MKKRALVSVLSAVIFSGTAFGALDRIYADNGSWQIEIISDVYFSDITVDPDGTVYMARSEGGLGRVYGNPGNWTVQPDMTALGDTGTDIYTDIDSLDGNYVCQIDDTGLERLYDNGAWWVNQDMCSGSYNAISVDRSEPAYHISFLARSSGGLDRHYYFDEAWQYDSDIGGTNVYIDIECKPSQPNRVFMVGPAGLDETWYTSSNGWTNESIITGTSLSCLTHDLASSWKVFVAKADGGLMQAYYSGGGWVTGDMDGAGTNRYVDIVANPGEANSLFMVNSVGGIEKAWWLGDGLGWANEVIIAYGDYVALAAGEIADEIFSVTPKPPRGLDRIYNDGYWQLESIIGDTYFDAVTVDPDGTVYMARSEGGLGRVYGNPGNWTVQPDMTALGDTGTDIYTDIDSLDGNYVCQIDDTGLERLYDNGAWWVNQDMCSGSYNAISVDRSEPAYHISFLARSSGGLDRHYYFDEAWQYDSDIGGTNVYIDIECKPSQPNRVFMVGPAGLDETWYTSSNGWTNESIITGTSLSCLTHDLASSWKVFVAKADGGLMQAYYSGGGWVTGDMDGAGVNRYVDIVANPDEPNSLFMVNSFGGLEKSWWLGNGLGWTNEVIVASGDYVALAANAFDEVYAVSSSPQTPSWNPLFSGIDHAILLSVPLVNVLRIDMENPLIRFNTTASNGDAPLDTYTQTTSEFLQTTGAEVAINANYFNLTGEPTVHIQGLVVSQGNVVSSGSHLREELLISTIPFGSSEAWFNPYPPTADLAGVTVAVAGIRMALTEGEILTSDPDSGLHPRTAVGISWDGRYLYMLTADGEQYYEGVWYDGITRMEVGALLKSCGAYTGLHLDSGGSTTMAISDGVEAKLLNVPDGDGTPGVERPVGNNLGVHALPLGSL